MEIPLGPARANGRLANWVESTFVVGAGRLLDAHDYRALQHAETGCAAKPDRNQAANARLQGSSSKELLSKFAALCSACVRPAWNVRAIRHAAGEVCRAAMVRGVAESQAGGRCRHFDRRRFLGAGLENHARFSRRAAVRYLHPLGLGPLPLSRHAVLSGRGRAGNSRRHGAA